MSAKSKSLWFVAGEASGDARAAELMQGLNELSPGMEFMGAGGPRMQAHAAKPFDNWTAEAGVLGLWDVLRHYGYFRKKFHTMIANIERLQPSAVLLVDYPGFNLRLAKALRDRKFSGKILYYISPQVWAWSRGRIPKMARFLDLMICVFPFEQPMYEASGLPTVFAGHPLLEALAGEKTGQKRDDELLAFFPGSREREVNKIFPIMAGAARRILQSRPDIRFEVSVVSEAHAARIRDLAGGLPLEVRCGNAHELMQRACAGVVCSGTATLEAAFFNMPYCLVYKVAWLTFEVGRRLVDVDCLGMVNILNNYQVNPPSDPRIPARPAPHIVREFVQHKATSEGLAGEALRLLNHPVIRERLVRDMQSVISPLSTERASRRAAQAVVDCLS